MCKTKDNQRIRERINTGWKFQKDDIEDAYSPDLDDSGWEKIKLPHD